MTVNFKSVEVDCVEFNCTMNQINEETVCEVDLLVNADIDIVEDIYSDPFVIMNEKTGYVFSGYRLEEYFDEDGLTRVICRK